MLPLGIIKKIMEDKYDKAGWANGYWSLETGPVEVDPSKMLRIHGYRDLGKVRPIIREAADNIAVLAKDLMTPQAHSFKIDVTKYGNDFMELADGTVFENVDFGSVLDNAPVVVVVVLTVGRALDEAVIAAMDKFEPLDALFLETAGWLGIESATKLFVRDLKKTALAHSRRVTRRLGPGYSYKVSGRPMDWPLNQQRRLFDVFGDIELPITLLESCAMLPKMSRSGMYGLTPLN